MSSEIANGFLDNRRIAVSEDQINAMTALWNHFYETMLYPYNQEADALHPEKCCVGTPQEHLCSMLNCHHPWDLRLKTKSQEMQWWDQYAKDHYREPAKRGSIDAELTA